MATSGCLFVGVVVVVVMAVAAVAVAVAFKSIYLSVFPACWSL